MSFRTVIPAISNIKTTIRGYETFDHGHQFWIKIANFVRPEACEFIKWFLELEIKKYHNYPFETHHYATGTENIFDPNLTVNRIKSYKLVGKIAHIDFEPIGENDPFPVFLEILRSEAKRLQYEVGSPYK